jgi:ABC-type sugar transport system ATPase subunit
MDEPTAALGVKESRKVLDLVLRLRESGAGVLVISHNMRQVFSIADRIAVMRHGWQLTCGVAPRRRRMRSSR